MGIYIGMLIVDPTVLDKLNRKHSVTEAEVREAFQWPASVDAVFEDHPEHGARWVGLATLASGREVFGALLPAQAWAGADAEDWVLKTARWL